MESRKSQLPDPAQWKGTWRDDWRIMGQEGYLLKRKLQHRRFDRQLVRADYDQCEFCWDVFDEDKAHPKMAFYEPVQQLWVCEECFQDFNPYFSWEVEEPFVHIDNESLPG